MKTNNLQKLRIGVLTFSTILFPATFYYLSPVLSIAGAAAGIVSGSVIVFLFLFLQSLLLGRSFCSWLCPVGGISELTTQARTKAVAVKKISWIKFFVWVPWIITLLLFMRRAGGFKVVEFGYQTEHGLSTTSLPALIVYCSVVLTFFLLSIIFGRRTGCHTICWISPFMIIGRSIAKLIKTPTLHIKSNIESCVSCGRCTNVCPMSLNVQQLQEKGEILDNNCILCGKCIDTCKRNTLDWAWRRAV